jgi:hypothetical protein
LLEILKNLFKVRASQFFVDYFFYFILLLVHFVKIKVVAFVHAELLGFRLFILLLLLALLVFCD